MMGGDLLLRVTTFPKPEPAPEAFHLFVRQCSDLELVTLQHELRQHTEDAAFVRAVLDELKRRRQAHVPET